MKKLLIISISILAFIISSCGNNASKKIQEDKGDTTKVEEKYLEGDLKIKIDSLVSELSKLNLDPVFTKSQSGKIVLSTKEKMIKPTYLLPPSKGDELVTLSQKYRATMMLRMDMAVAYLYEMPLEDYKQAIAKLLININNPAFKLNLNEDAKNNPEQIRGFITKLYDGEVSNNTVNFFWDAIVASLIEDLYILTQNTDLFIPCFTDQSASEITYRFILVHEGIQEMIKFHPELENLQSILEPLRVINAINVEQLRTQVNELKDEIAIAREKLLQ